MNYDSILRIVGIDHINQNPKLLIEKLGDKTHLGVIGFLIAWYVLYFIIIEIFIPFTVIFFSDIGQQDGKIINGYYKILLIISDTSIWREPFINYVRLYINWNAAWLYSLFLMYYFRSSFLRIENCLIETGRVSEGELDLFKERLFGDHECSFKNKLNISLINILRLLVIILLFIPTYYSYICQKLTPTILFGYLPLNEIGLNNTSLNPIFGPEIASSDLALIINLLHWFPGVMIQLIILADLFAIIISFVLLGKELYKIAVIDLRNIDRRGGLGFLGDIYYKISLTYLIGALLLFYVCYVTFLDENLIDPMPELELVQYLILITIISLFGLFLFIFPQRSINKLIIQGYRKKFRKIINKKSNKMKNKDHLMHSFYSIQILLYLNEIENINSYSFGRNNTIKIILAVLINIGTVLLKLYKF
ncbi:hypothetical protein [Methanothrix harundinacea]|uniref:hypothetical protein n=1 Tax=Methanothrix harundinacea TaxID=301375 RepID=UPI000A5E5004|nr:hypothetical protein [Methanothrix harundinacea]